MKEYNENLSNIFIDIDDTITPDLGETFFPNSIETIKQLSVKANIFLWSKGDMEYIYSILKKSGLTDYVSMCIPKPSLIIDDLNFKDFSGAIQIKNGDWSSNDIKSIQLESDWFEDGEFLRNRF